MELGFEDGDLRKIAGSAVRLRQKYGAARAKKLQQRFDAVLAVEAADELFPLPGRWHELSADRHGQLSADLDHPYRLILVPATDTAPPGKSGIDWSAVTALEVVEIADTH